MNRLARRFQELRVALLLLTRLPVGPVSDDMPTIAAARWAYPLAGVLVGGIGWAAFAGAMRLGLDPWIAALLAAGAGVLMTGGLHEDGLADVADGFGGGRDREAKLAIMRDSRIGSYGVLALIFAIGLKTNAMAETGEGLGAAAFVALAVMSRFCMVLALERLAPARADGLGAAASGRGGWRLVTAFLIAAAALVPLGGGGGLAAVVMAVAAGAVVLLAHRQIGGQTGDVLGAVQMVAETAGWLALAAMLGTP